MPPTVSVLMPTLNTKSYIVESVESVLGQTFQDFEIIVVDGGSSDGTLEYVERIDDDRMQVFRNCGGIVPSLRKGIENAGGKYIARVDSDTVSLPERFERQVEFLDANPDCGAVGSYVRRIDADTGNSRVDTRPLTHEGITSMLVRRNPMVHPTMMIRRDAFEVVGNYREYHFEDYELVTRLAGSYRLANLDEVLVEYYIREGSVMRTTSALKRALANTVCGLRAVRTLNYPLPQRLWMYTWRFSISVVILLRACVQRGIKRLSTSGG